MPRRSRSRSPGPRRESRSPILRRRRSEHDRGGGGGRGGGRGREREKVRERRHGSQDPPMRRSSDRPVDRNTHNERIGRNEGDRRMWQNDVHPSRAMDVNPESSAMEENSARRTDRFVTERFKRSNAGRSFQRGGTEGRRGGRRWERRSEGDGRGWRGDEERGRGERGGGEREDGGQGVTGEMEEGVEGEVGEQRSQFEGRRGRGRWRVAKEREEMEREEQVFREKRLMDSLTDPRDVPKGSWYFEHDDRKLAQTSQPSRRYSTGDERYRRDRRGQRDWERERERQGEVGQRRGGERERDYRQRSPRVWRHDMFEQLEQEEAGEGEEWGQEGWVEGEQEMGNERQQRRSVVHRLGTRPEDTRGDHRLPQRDARADGIWAHDKFSEHDKLVAYPIQQHKARQRRKERGRGEEREEGKAEDFEKGKEQTDISMDTM